MGLPRSEHQVTAAGATCHANRTLDLLDREKKCLPGSIPIDSTPGVPSVSQEATLDQFAACLEDLEDPRSGNAALP
jgi:hypothetical protein